MGWLVPPARAILVQPPPEGPQLYLKAATLAPSPLASAGSDALSFLSSGAKVALVQFTGPVRPEWKTAVAADGVRLLHYIPDFGFVARADDSSFRALARQPFIRWIGPYLPAYRISAAVPSSGATQALVALEPGADRRLAGQAARALGLSADPAGASLWQVGGDAAAIRSLAERDDVLWIGPPFAARPLNDKSRDLMGVNGVWNDLDIYGEDQIVAIVDTGLDTGNEATLLPDFQGRVAKAIALSSSGDWGDDFGHGTHIAGNILGQGKALEGPPDPQSFAGVAPRAKLLVQAYKLASDGTADGMPDDLHDLYTPAYEAGARIHNNSWGDDFSPYGEYSIHSGQVDDFTWNHPDMLIVFAAGNDGTDSPIHGSTPEANRTMPRGRGDGRIRLGSLYAPGTAKNAIAVGASEGDRPPGQGWGGFSESTWRLWGFQSPPISTDYVSDNASGMAAFSSRGPTADGRLKPDLVAPGTDIISTLSQRSSAGGMWGIYSPGYAFNGGTSFSAGFVSGAAALVREWLQRRGHASDPSAALIKALLLNAARDLAPGQYGGVGASREIADRPNPTEGWGRVDVGMAIDPPAPLAVTFVDDRNGLPTGGARTWLLRVAQGGQPLRIMAVWTDYPGAPDAAVALVNDLDLSVVRPDGQTETGNGTTDRLNNVEAVSDAAAEPGVYRITVTGHNVPQGPQPFALAALGAAGRLTQPGDVDGDGAVTVADALKALQAAVGVAALSPDETLAADVAPRGAPDGQVDLRDVTELLRAAVGLDNPTAG